MNGESENRQWKNIKYSTIAYILKITLQFVVRLVFVKSLPIEYLGINGLLSNFLSMLSLAELGVGPAIIYSLYQPLAKKDTATIKALIALFKKAYTAIGLFIIGTGICLLPWLDWFIKRQYCYRHTLVLSCIFTQYRYQLFLFI